MPWASTRRQPSRRSRRVLGLDQRFPAAEVVVEVNGPAEAGLPGRRGRFDVVSVQGQRRLQTQGVARRQAAGRAAGLDQRPQQPIAGGSRRHDLEAVLAGVAGAAEEELPPRFLQPAAAVPLDRRCARQQRRHALDRLRPLHRQQHRIAAVAQVGQLGIAAGNRFFDGAADAVGVGRVADHQVVVFGQAIGDQVVDDATLLVAEEAVGAGAHVQIAGVAAEQAA